MLYHNFVSMFSFFVYDVALGTGYMHGTKVQYAVRGARAPRLRSHHVMGSAILHIPPFVLNTAKLIF